MIDVDEIALGAARRIYSINVGRAIGGKPQYVAMIQCAVRDAIQEYQQQARAKGGEAVAWDDPAVDPIVTKLYRKFKEWSQRGFSADDVTWCEVRGYVAELLNTHPPKQLPWISVKDRLPEIRTVTLKTPNGILVRFDNGRILHSSDVTELRINRMRNGPRQPTKYEAPAPARITHWLDLDAAESGPGGEE